MTKVFDVAMIGASGTGKTSLLTSMYAQFRGALNKTRLSLEPEDQVTSQWLQQQRVQLDRISREIMVRERGIPGSTESRTLSFRLMTQDSKGYAHLAMRFADYPGGWLFPAGDWMEDGQDQRELRDRLANSGVLLVAVDTPALMYDNGRYHQALNRPQQVDELVSDWLRSGEKRLVVFVPLKCEKWVQTDRGLQELYESVSRGYGEVLSSLTGEAGLRVTCTPVQTVGSLDHVRIFDAEGVIESQFRGRTANGGYSPAWAIEPLRQVLLDLIRERQERNSLWEDFARLFGHQEDLDDAIKALVKSGKSPSSTLPVGGG